MSVSYKRVSMDDSETEDYSDKQLLCERYSYGNYGDIEGSTDDLGLECLIRGHNRPVCCRVLRCWAHATWRDTFYHGTCAACFILLRKIGKCLYSILGTLVCIVFCLSPQRSVIFVSRHRNHTKAMKGNRTTTIIIGVVVAAVLLGAGIGIGYAVGHSKASSEHKEAAANAHMRSVEDIENQIINNLNKENIQKNLKLYTSRPRMSGTPGGREIENILYDEWMQLGLDHVRLTPYDVLMSYPNTSNPNKVQLLSGDKVVYEAATKEKILTEEGNQSEIIPPFNAYAVPGVATGDLVYVNYGRIEDFLFLVKNKSMSLEGKILIARYGKIFRGDKVENAQHFNASGIIMYTDPSDFNKGNQTYPDTWWMPGYGVQRGTIGTDGDRLTPFYPATEYAFRLKNEDVQMFTIPAQPIGYADAYNFLKEMKGEDAPPDWQGALNITYKLGPGFTDKTLKAKLSVHNFEETRTVKNVIGYLRGTEEPDRYVLLGNHHDSWVFGAIDPLSGSAALTEIIRVLGEFKSQGIRPKRTIVFCSWAAEEHGLFGSTEWVEEYMKVLYERAIAYLNVDYACDYHYVLVAGMSPLLQDSLYQTTKKVPNPDKSSAAKNVYDDWKSKTPSDINTNEPSVYYSLGSGSDMATFYQRAGVPSVDMWFTYDEKKWDILSYPTYHSQYETFRMFTKFIDPDFEYSLAMGRIWSVMAWNLANVDVLPFDTTRYSAAIKSFVQNLNKQFGALWKKNGVNFAALESAADNFTVATQEFQNEVKKKMNEGSLSALEKRTINDKMMQLERAFIDPEGLPGRRIYKHVMFAPSKHDSYSDNSFPGIADTMFEIEQGDATLWGTLKQQVYVATYTVQSAANTLRDVGL